MEQGTKPARWWIAVTFVFGAAGALTSVGLYSAKTYSIPPLRVELSAMPALAGASQLTIRPRPGIQTGYAEAPTHPSPITLRMTVVGVDAAGLARQPAVLGEPLDTATHIRFSEAGKKAFTDFGIRLLVLALAGGAAGGVIVSFGRWRRILGAALAGALALGIVGALLYQTYDVNQFANTHYVAEPPRGR